MEKVYVKMTHSGVLSIIGGICAIAVGVMIIISGGLLVKNRKMVLF